MMMKRGLMRHDSKPVGRLPSCLVALLTLTLLSGAQICGCSDNARDDITVPAIDYSGSYYTTFGTTKNAILVLTQADTLITWSLTLRDADFSGSGTRLGPTIVLHMAIPFTMTATLNFSDETAFKGTWTITGATPEDSPEGTIMGLTAPWKTYDFGALGVPMFVDTDYIELAKIESISLFRSSAGHDYSDDFESCRSMKHYYIPKPEIDPSAIIITSPVDGVVTGYVNEWAGTQVGIESAAYPGIIFIIFHVNLSTSLKPGDAVTAGQELGAHVGSQTWSDIAVGMVTPSGWRLVSYLETMTDERFADYQARGMASRGDAIISASARDADSLFCNGETFTGTGDLPSLFHLN